MKEMFKGYPVLDRVEPAKTENEKREYDEAIVLWIKAGYNETAQELEIERDFGYRVEIAKRLGRKQ